MLPISLWRNMFSITTTELVTRIPTAVENPVRVSIFSVNPAICRKIKVEMIEIGMDNATIRVLRQSCRKSSKINPVSRIPIQIVLRVSATVERVNSLSSRITFNWALAGRVFCSSGRAWRTSSAMFTTFPSELLVIEIRTTLSSVLFS
ncbi:hypothetical protein DSECCO2_498370 [anaerobic digester metagenome]